MENSFAILARGSGELGFDRLDFQIWYFFGF